MPSENPTHEGNDKPGRRNAPSLIQIAFPQQPTLVFIFAMIIGLLLILMSIGSSSYIVLNGMQSNLLLASGVGIILAAFGGQANVRLGIIFMAGAAGVAFGLFYYLQDSDLFLKGRIEGLDYNTYRSVEIMPNDVDIILGTIIPKIGNEKRSHYNFAIFMKEIENFNSINVRLSRKDGTGEPVLQVKKDKFKWYFGRNQMMVWDLRKNSNEPGAILTLFDISKDTEVAREVNEGTFPISRTMMRPHLINKAYAQESSLINVPLMLERLKAEDTPTRRSARAALSKAPIESIPVIMEKLRQEGSNYQVKLGICVALTEMLRADKNRRTQISSKLTEDDLNKLLDAAGDPDRTVRIYATEFLFDLGDKRATKLAIPRAANTNDDNARYNWLLLSQEGWRMLTKAEIAELTVSYNEAYERSGEKTRRLFDKLPL